MTSAFGRILIVASALACSTVDAGLIPGSERDKMIMFVLQGGFWGKAKLSNGEFVQPSSEKERTTVPIPNAVAYRVMDAGEVSGLGQWCGLDWESHYSSLTKAARSKELSDKQVAFVSVLHGFAQAYIADVMGKQGQCDEAVRAKVKRWMDDSLHKGL